MKYPTIEEMLDVTLQNVRDASALEFLESLQEWFDEHGELTDAQEEALERFYDRIPRSKK